MSSALWRFGAWIRTAFSDSSATHGPAHRRAIAWLIGLSALPAVAQLAELVLILSSRLFYPYDCHWVEGGSLLHAYRLLHGQPIYPAPTDNAGFVPFPYPPVLYLTVAALGRIVGLDYATGRVVVIAAMAVGVTILARDVYARFRDFPLAWVWPLLTLGAIAAGFPATGAWYDAVMSDPMALGLSVASARLMLAGSNEPGRLGTRRLVIASVLMALTVFTKQTYAALVAWQLVFLCVFRPRRGLALVVGTAGLIALLVLIAQGITHGHFAKYVAGQLVQHGFRWHLLWQGFGIVTRFAPYIPLALIGAVLLALARALSAPSLLWTGMVVAAFPAALLPYAKPGGWYNNFLPIVVIAPAATLCVLGDFCHWLKPRQKPVFLIAGALAAGFYLLVRTYPASPYVADEARRVAAARLNFLVRTLGGDVLIPTRPFLAIRNHTHVEQIHVGGWYDALLAGRHLSFDDFVRRSHPRFVLLSDQEPAVIVEAFRHDYVLIGNTPSEMWSAQTLEFRDEDNSDPSMRWHTGQLRWVLERNSPDPPGSRCLFDFESKSYDGWTTMGDAFTAGPTEVDTQVELHRSTRLFAFQGVIVGVVGRSLASSAPAAKGDAATGVLRSPVFTIDRENLELRVAGGKSQRTRVELHVNGRMRFQDIGSGNDYLRTVRWNLASYRGLTAELVIVDEDKAAHILVDHVCLAD